MLSDCYRVHVYKFGVNSSSRIPVRVQTDRQTNKHKTRLKALPTPWVTRQINCSVTPTRLLTLHVN